MTSARSERSVSEARSKSDDLDIEIIVFACGHGDTILLHLPGDKWALVDCYLPKGPVRRRFFRLIEDRNISRLDLLCLTHPHRDHFWGMSEVVEYFTSSSRSIGIYCDTGFDPQQIIDILKQKRFAKSEVAEYEKLHCQLDDLIENKVIGYYPADKNTEPIPVVGTHQQVRLVPVAPDPSVVRRMTRSTLEKGRVHGSLNALSLILALHVATDTRECNMLLTGDAEASALEESAELLKEGLGNPDRRFDLDVIKVPHHGSATSYSESLMNLKRSGSACVAAISVGTRWATVPDREVIRGYLNRGWTVLATTKRVPRKRRDLALTLSGRTVGPLSDVQEQSITIKWTSRDGLTWAPDEAVVSHDDLPLYETSLNSS